MVYNIFKITFVIIGVVTTNSNSFLLAVSGYEILQYMNVLLMNILVELLSQNQHPVPGILEFSQMLT